MSLLKKLLDRTRVPRPMKVSKDPDGERAKVVTSGTGADRDLKKQGAADPKDAA